MADEVRTTEETTEETPETTETKETTEKKNGWKPGWWIVAATTISLRRPIF